MSFLDILLIILYLPLCLFIGKQIKNKHRNNPLYQKWFMKGLWAKLLGGLAFALVYTFYYEYGGDTRSYFRDSGKLVEALFISPAIYWDVMQHSFENISAEALDVLRRMLFHDPREYYVVNFVSIFNFLGFGSYFSMTLLVALFTYWGVWHFFLLLVEKFPKIEKQMAFAVLFIPSVFFWGSGISKDSLILCAVGLILYHVNQIASGKFWQFGSLLIIGGASYFMFVVKAYVLISLLPAIILWRTLHLRDKIKNSYIRAAILPLVGAVSIFAMVYTLNFMAQYNKTYSMDSFVDTAQSMQGWHYVEGENSGDNHGRGSSYTLGAYDENSWQGMLKIFPAAVNVTFFRPYIWEVKNAGMLAQAFESLVFLLFTLFAVLKTGPIKVYRYISNDSFLLMCVVFAIFFGFAVGFSSYNFGALSRYKIPAVPFFIAALFIIRHKAREAKMVGYVKARQKREFREGSQAVPGFAR
ncbi:hypothetical protein G3O08_07855 [Cryomorpha ignava]|uniref:Uncharacterized protein n=1 Tax=Cryomorpha ignava TaxID=101383 RepID=A0A7K3WRF0_9FLAO|nr:hypothetical protein [Cryomorpha ignava]NEN23412.1 hypothetical protein [Cryomorpha ignava]